MDIQKLIDTYKLDNLAEHLFPGNKYPKAALKRILDGESLLNSEQITKLASMVGLSVAELFSDQWAICFGKNNKHHFTLHDYDVELNTETWVTKIFHKKSLFHESVLHEGSLSLNDYFILLNKIIENGKN